MEIRLTTFDNKETTIQTESDKPKSALKEALNSPLAPEDIREIKAVKRIDIAIKNE